MQLDFYNVLFKNYRGAIIEQDEKYRYSLWRVWDEELPRVLFIMLNPSTADSKEDDPTLRRCINFASKWGYGSLEVVNLFAYRTPNPKKLFEIPDPIGEKNDEYIEKALERSEKIILAWGTKGNLFSRDQEVLKLLKKQSNKPLYALELTKNGFPRHPLYVKSNIIPIHF
ncbi:DUF1643 domain-containing protein [Virgibacillus halodenitrificans]|uniref:DUF1643 domain-containing protein n=1 Tax=Virgibacillus halodenitrificans TaxID=1482 RepID=UPI0024C0D9E1|nr:DUF1643 domain-containing protein [Virgibacillus halodenitrificans]WHX25113.1 DUF1643 domain-containing protein [Virgibacillus halodenitrificans]